jgi:7,8-dihydropterin-6-yl-methyl-4-(beta-D-ribofuranosyl)aminobenzene 5'-phosphate synthase
LDIDAVVISHPHADHTGGLEALLDLGIRPTFYLLSAFPGQLKEGLAPRGEVVESVAGQEIFPGIFTTGKVGSTIPEQALILKTDEGLIVLTGCAHPGVVEMAERARELFPDPLKAVLGGFHLMQASKERILSVIRDLQAMGIQEAGPTHCSGETAMQLFSEAFGEGYVRMGVGKVLTLRAVGAG